MPTSDELRMLQALPLDLKVRRTEQRIREWVDYWGKDHVCVSFSGGKDSTVLLHIVRKLYGDEIPAVFVNTGLEYIEIQQFVKRFSNVVILRPEINFKEVITRYGYPVISKEVSKCIEATRAYAKKFIDIDPGAESSNCWESVRTAAQNMGKGTTMIQKMFGVGLAGSKLTYQGIYNKSRYSSAKYIPLLNADFLISDKCCYIMKKSPLKAYEKETGRRPIVGMLAEESFLRRSSWLKNGCNAFSGSDPKSNPMSFWTNQDVLRYIAENNIPLATVYGEVVTDDEHGQITMLRYDEQRFHCTGMDRSGCIYCMYGAGHEPVSCEGRFCRLARTHPKQYDYIMRGGGYDPEDGYWKPTKEGLGFAHVFDEINRLIPAKTGRPYIRYLPEGGEMEKARKLDEEKKKG
jgi:3'-phosphoadenosine 5'-phosphosulfate sulfotransferase (PAPS reductase)/FAD synthetase